MQHPSSSAPASSDAGAVPSVTRDATAPATRPRRLGRRFLLLGAAIAGLVLVAGVIGVTAFLYPILPRNVVMATGVEGTGYADLGERYRQIMARQGVQLKVLTTSGTLRISRCCAPVGPAWTWPSSKMVSLIRNNRRGSRPSAPSLMCRCRSLPRPASVARGFGASARHPALGRADRQQHATAGARIAGAQ